VAQARKPFKGSGRQLRVDVPVEGHNYAVLIGEGLLDRAGDLIGARLRGQRILVVMDEAVATPHAQILFKSLSSCTGVEAYTCKVASGEQSKNIKELTKLWMSLGASNVGRDGAIIAIGGGMVGDLAGFAASTWLRGIDLFLIPTTLLAMVDASVGGKTAINSTLGKNLIGSFWQPRLVLADVSTLRTLSEPEYCSGLAEVIKYGIVKDRALFELIEERCDSILCRDPETLSEIIEWCCSIKGQIVVRDERESGERELLNFGHTIGHAIESKLGYGVVRHGEAVAIGMMAEARIAAEIGTGWSDAAHERLEELLTIFRLPCDLKREGAPSARALLDSTYSDKKVRSGQVRYALPTALGEAKTGFEVSDEIVLKVLRELGAAE
jgi:3-dehydroquinate synthase